MFSESDSKLYTNFEFCEKEDHRHFKYIIANHGGKKKIKKSLHILINGASGVQVGDIEQVIV